MDLKKLFENKLFRMLAIVIGVILVIIVIIVVVLAVRGTRVRSYSSLEEKMVSAARSYYEKNSDSLPKEVGKSVEVGDADLTSGGFMKSLQNIAPKGSTCTGKVVVKNVNQGYFYQAFLDCGDRYQTTTLSNYIKSHVGTVMMGAGLYENSGNYTYRGENPNNYVKFAGRVYRIVQVNSDGTIQIIATEKHDRVVWDDRYNQVRGNSYGINEYPISRIKDSLLSYVNSKAFTDSERAMLEPFSLCLGKVSAENASGLGSECSTTLDGQVIGLLPVSSYLYVSLDSACRTPEDGACQNYNYLEVDYNWWTLTGVSDNTYQVFAVGNGAYSTRASSEANPREVLRLTENTVYVRGNGSLESPYIIK